MFVNESTYNEKYSYRCSSCGNAIKYSNRDMLLSRKHVSGVGSSVVIYCRCQICGNLQKISE